jgi:acyl-CoA dehydrogenase
MEFLLSLLSKEQIKLRESLLELCGGELFDLEKKAGETDRIDGNILKLLAEKKILGYTVPGKYGSGPETMSLVSFCLIREELAKRCQNAELIFTMQGLGAGPITAAGTDKQKQAYLPLAASGKKIFSFALTEPGGGSDAAGIVTRAERKGGEYILNGEKTFISMAPDADIYTVFAKTDPDKGVKGISAFIVEKGSPGFTPGKRLPLVAAHPTGSLLFTDCKIPAENRLGEEGEGFKIAMQTLDFFRTAVGACAVGFAQAAFEDALAYAKKRVAFGQPISGFQLVQAKLADMATKISAARLLVFRAAFLKDQGRARITKESAMAKFFATEAAQQVIDNAVQIHGGYGISKGYLVERLYREIRMLRIYEGTSEILQTVIAGQLLKE